MADEPLQTVSDPEEEEGGPVKTFLEHLEDLRWVLIKCFVSLALGMVTCMVAANYVTAFLERPLKALQTSGVDLKLEAIDPLGPVTIIMKVGLYGGLTIALPFLLYFIADFVLPALKRNEKKYFKRAFAIGSILFFAGVALCYFLLLKISLFGLVAMNKWLGLGATVWRAQEYFSFVITFMVGMGLVFELPVVLLTLVRMGVISHETLVKSRVYLLIGNMVVCAFITPDALSTVFMVIPVQALLEICIMISRYWEKQRRIAEAAAITASRQLESTS
jgi:sec-independent protein translocase protein TatC